MMNSYELRTCLFFTAQLHLEADLFNVMFGFCHPTQKLKHLSKNVTKAHEHAGSDEATLPLADLVYD